MNTRELAKLLEEAKVPQITWTYADEPNEQHQTIFRATEVKAYTWTLEK